MGVLGGFTLYPSLFVFGDPSKSDLIVLFVGALSAIASGIPFPVIGILFGQLLDDFNAATCDEKDGSGASSTESQGSINNRILLIVYLAIAQFVTIYVHLFCWSLTGNRLAHRIRERYLRNLLRQEPSYFDNLPPGEIASRLDADIQTIRSGTSEKVGICLATLSFFVTAYVIAFIKNYRLAAELISLIPAYFLLSFVGSHYIEKYSGIMSDHAASASSIASEALNNIIVVHAFGAASRLEEKFSAALQASESAGLKKAAAIGIQSGLLYFISYGANGLAFWQGSRFIADAVSSGSSGVTVGATFTVIFILVEATLLLSQVAPFIHLFGAAVSSYSKLRDGIERQTLIDGVGSDGNRVTNADSMFEFQDVSFCYPSRPELQVLDHFSLAIPPKKHTAIVGFSGSGKSTVAALLTRLYDPLEGQIFFNGQDLRDLNLHDLRSMISLVQQEASLLDRSLLENIAQGLINSNDPDHAHLQETLMGPQLGELAADVRQGKDLNASAKSRGSVVAEIVELVEHAASLADAHGFIKAMHHGYGTLAGSRGTLISGGQKSRIAIARALVKNPAILILDEATAALDSGTEQRIQKTLSKVSLGRTVVTIAHRLSTIVGADNIVVMAKGKLMEQGPHAALMAQGGIYAEFVRLQTSAPGSVSEVTLVERDNAGEIRIARSSEDVEPEVSTSTLDLLGTTDTIETMGKVAKTGVIETTDKSDEKWIDTATEEVTDEPHTPKKSLRAIIKGYSPAFKPHLPVIAISLLAASAVGGSFSAEAVIFGNTVGSLNLCNGAAYIRSHGSFWGLMFFVLAIIEFFANFASWTGFGWVTEKVVHSVRILSFRSIFEQDLEWHQTGRTPAQLLSYITKDGAALAGLSGSVIGTLFSISINLVVAIILTHIIAWRIALVCLALVPLLLGCGLLELRVLERFEEKHATAFVRSVDIAVEAVSSIKTVAALSLEDSVMKAYGRSLEGPRKELLVVTLKASLWQAMTYFLGNLVNALAYWWGSKQILAGNYTQTQFLIVVFSLLVSALLWSTMFALAPELTSARAAMSRILGLIEIGSQRMCGRIQDIPARRASISVSPAGAVEKPTEQPATPQASSVEMVDVHFAYPARPELPILKGLSLNILPGQFCALVGPSGAGKSTAIALIERLYHPQRGHILIDGCDVTTHGTTSFRDSIALVPQETVLFEGSLSFNLGLGARPGETASPADIERACRLANIHDTIEALPQGYDTLCGPGGTRFSGGQRQRLAIARALVRRPRLLILDEPSSALDAESERLLQEGLDRAATDVTVIAIAHRLQTIRRADVIFLVEGGTCVDRGTHAELMERSESYRANYLHQTVA